MSRLVLSATFTADPIRPVIAFWIEQLGLDLELEIAAYNQVFQQLLDPASPLSRNTGGANALLIRLEDWFRRRGWLRRGPPLSASDQDEFLSAVASCAERRATPLLVLFCPPTDGARRRAVDYDALEAALCQRLAAIEGVHPVRSDTLLAAYPVARIHDPRRDALAHIPYSDSLFTALGTLLLRRLFGLLQRPYKVIAVDCDNTLWRGVCAEDGPLGVTIEPGHARLQSLLAERAAAGFLVCLCSKNSEADVRAVFERNPAMRLGPDSLTAWRVNWQPKSSNLIALADELELGLDSFVFIDDSPIECAEVTAALPQVLCLQLPAAAADIPAFLDASWALDRGPSTAEDGRRTELYRHQLARRRLRARSASLADFLAGLELEVRIDPAATGDLPRIAQLTQRTNQFHCAGIRRSQAEVAELLAAPGTHCLVTRVRDRFGDYGLVGVLIAAAAADRWVLETLLLSCRALGRGVEQRMLARAGELAAAAGAETIVIPYTATERNAPARQFLAALPGADGELADGRRGRTLASREAAALRFDPQRAGEPDEPDGTPAAAAASEASEAAAASAAPGHADPVAALARIAAELRSLADIEAAIRSTPQQAGEDPGDDLRQRIRAMVRQQLARVEVEPRFGDDDSLVLSGRLDSLKVVDLAAQLEEHYGLDFAAAGFNQYDFDSVNAIAALVEAATGSEDRAAGD